MRLKPLSDRVIVQRDEADTRSKGGILMPDVAKEKPARGTVIETGPGKLNSDGTLAKMQVKSRDRVLFVGYAGAEVEVEGKELLVMSQDEILAVVEE